MLAVKNEEVIPDKILISDTSDHSAFIFSKGKKQLIQDYAFSPAEQTFSSSHRELLALLETLQTHPDFFRFLMNPSLYWQMDSQNAARFILKGSRKTLIQSDILKIK